MRHSRRYPGYLRVYNLEYRKALVRVLREDASDLIEMLDLKEVLEDLANRLEDPDHFSALGKLTRGILGEANVHSPLKMDAEAFNLATERYYRTTLRSRQWQEAFQFLLESARQLESISQSNKHDIWRALDSMLGNTGITEFLADAQQEVTEERATKETLEKLICLMLIIICYERDVNNNRSESGHSEALYGTSVYRA